jgi:hypothetical protein
MPSICALDCWNYVQRNLLKDFDIGHRTDGGRLVSTVLVGAWGCQKPGRLVMDVVLCPAINVRSSPVSK